MDTVLRITPQPLDKRGHYMSARCPYCRCETVSDADGEIERGCNHFKFIEESRAGSHFIFERHAQAA